jgi:hypothetical protein
VDSLIAEIFRNCLSRNVPNGKVLLERTLIQLEPAEIRAEEYYAAGCDVLCQVP